MSRHPNYYRILGVTPLAGEEEIKHAYRALAKRYHPDTMPPERQEWAREQMARINVAYQVLQDRDRRAAYDLERAYGPHSRRLERPDAEALSTFQGQSEGTRETTASTLWRRQRARERLRRQLVKRWRAVAIASGIGLVVGIGATLLLVRTQSGYALSTLLNAGFLAMLAISLGAANR